MRYTGGSLKVQLRPRSRLSRGPAVRNGSNAKIFSPRHQALRLFRIGGKEAPPHLTGRDATHRHERFHTTPYEHMLAIWLFPNVKPIFKLADLEPAALGGSPHHCRKKRLNRTGGLWLRALPA